MQKLQLAISPSIKIQIKNFQSQNCSTHLNLQSSRRHQSPIQSETHRKIPHNSLASQSRPKLEQKLKSNITQSYDIQIGNFKSLNSSIQKDLQFLFRTQRPILDASDIKQLKKEIGNYRRKRRLGHHLIKSPMELRQFSHELEIGSLKNPRTQIP